VKVCQRWIGMMMTEEIGDGIGGDHEGAWSGWYDKRATEGDTMGDGRGRWSEGRIEMIEIGLN
jgi:hypothetical protein